MKITKGFQEAQADEARLLSGEENINDYECENEDLELAEYAENQYNDYLSSEGGQNEE